MAFVAVSPMGWHIVVEDLDGVVLLDMSGAFEQEHGGPGGEGSDDEGPGGVQINVKKKITKSGSQKRHDRAKRLREQGKTAEQIKREWDDSQLHMARRLMQVKQVQIVMRVPRQWALVLECAARQTHTIRKQKEMFIELSRNSLNYKLYIILRTYFR